MSGVTNLLTRLDGLLTEGQFDIFLRKLSDMENPGRGALLSDEAALGALALIVKDYPLELGRIPESQESFFDFCMQSLDELQTSSQSSRSSESFRSGTISPFYDLSSFDDGSRSGYDSDLTYDSDRSAATP